MSLVPIPQQVNGYDVHAAIRVPARDGEFLNQWIVVVRKGGGASFIVWHVAWNPEDLGGSYVATNGDYELDEANALRRMLDRTPQFDLT